MSIEKARSLMVEGLDIYVIFLIGDEIGVDSAIFLGMRMRKMRCDSGLRGKF